jgi:hypothetical protein
MAIVVGVGAFSSSFRGLELVPAKQRCLVPGERRDAAQTPAVGRHYRK